MVKVIRIFETKWLWFYTYIRLPLSMLFSLLYLCGFLIVADSLFSLIVPLFLLGILVLYTFTFIGLIKRTSWAYKLNWCVLACDSILPVLTGWISIGYGSIPISLGQAGLWFIPNAIYFKKRRSLFIPEEEGIEGNDWLWFYTYIRMPSSCLVLLLPLYMCLCGVPSDLWELLRLLITLGLLALYTFNFIGLIKKRWWGYKLNWGVLVCDCVILASIFFVNKFSVFLMGYAIAGLLWFILNAIYFKKRKHLFGKQEKESIEDNEQLGTNNKEQL